MTPCVGGGRWGSTHLLSPGLRVGSSYYLLYHCSTVMSYNDPSGIRLMYEGVAADEEEKEEAGAARAPDRRQDIEPTLIRSAVEEGVEPLGHNHVVNTNLPMQTSGSADLFAAVDGPAYKGQLMDATQPSVTSSSPILNKQLKSDNPHEDASLLKGAGDGEAVMIDAHYLGNDGTNANLEGQAAVLDGNVYDADAFALTGGYFVKRRCIIAIVGLFVLAAVVVGGVCGSGKCSSSPGFIPSVSPTTVAPTTMVPSLVPSFMPTVSNTSSAMIWFINSVTLSGNFATYPIPPDSSGSATSEERALAWLIQEAPLKLSAENESDRNRLVQRYALLTLWYSLNGDAWVKNDGWLVAEDECSWYGIECINDQVTTVGTTQVLVGIWSQNNLSGTIPADVALLASVIQINLGGNQKITGSLLPSIANLNILQSFNAASCGLRYC